MSTTTEVQTPPAELVELYHATGQYGGGFSTALGWWTNGVMALHLGDLAQTDERWYANCGFVSESTCACDCECCEECDDCWTSCEDTVGACTHLVWKLGEPRNLDSFIAVLPTGELPAVSFGARFVDPMSNAHVPVLAEDGRELFAVNPAYLTAAQRYVNPTEWGTYPINRGNALIGKRDGAIVAALMSEAKSR